MVAPWQPKDLLGDQLRGGIEAPLGGVVVPLGGLVGVPLGGVVVPLGGLGVPLGGLGVPLGGPISILDQPTWTRHGLGLVVQGLFLAYQDDVRPHLVRGLMTVGAPRL